MTRTLFDKCEKKRADRADAISQPKTDAKDGLRYPLTNVIICAKCRGPMAGDSSSNKQFRYYRCSIGRGQLQKCKQPGVRADYLEDVVIRYLAMISLPLGFDTAVKTGVAAAKKAAPPLARRQTAQEIERKIREYGQLVVDRIWTKEMAQAEVAELRKDLVELELPPPTQDSIVSLNVRFHDFLQVWDRATGEQRHALAKSVFERIEVDDRQVSAIVPRHGWLPLFEEMYARWTPTVPAAPSPSAVKASSPAMPRGSPTKKAAASTKSKTAASERKTGVKHAEVVTARLVQDERGWLRLAG